MRSFENFAPNIWLTVLVTKWEIFWFPNQSVNNSKISANQGAKKPQIKIYLKIEFLATILRIYTSLEWLKSLNAKKCHLLIMLQFPLQYLGILYCGGQSSYQLNHFPVKVFAIPLGNIGSVALVGMDWPWNRFFKYTKWALMKIRTNDDQLMNNGNLVK